MNTSSSDIINKVIRNPISKIIIGWLICFLLPVLINKLFLDHLFQLLGFNEEINRSVRVCITTILLTPLCYHLYLKSWKTGKGAAIMTNGMQGLYLIMQIIPAIAKEYGWESIKN